MYILHLAYVAQVCYVASKPLVTFLFYIADPNVYGVIDQGDHEKLSEGIRFYISKKNFIKYRVFFIKQ